MSIASIAGIPRLFHRCGRGYGYGLTSITSSMEVRSTSPPLPPPLPVPPAQHPPSTLLQRPLHLRLPQTTLICLAYVWGGIANPLKVLILTLVVLLAVPLLEEMAISS